MKRFTFTLRSLERVRELRREKEEITLTQLRAEVQRAEEEIERLDASQRSAIDSYNQRLGLGRAIDIGELELEANHLKALDRRKRDAVVELEGKRQACARQTELVAAAVRDVKVTYKLRENQQMRHRAEADRHEQNASDELVSANFARKMSQTK